MTRVIEEREGFGAVTCYPYNVTATISLCDEDRGDVLRWETMDWLGMYKEKKDVLEPRLVERHVLRVPLCDSNRIPVDNRNFDVRIVERHDSCSRATCKSSVSMIVSSEGKLCY